MTHGITAHNPTRATQKRSVESLGRPTHAMVVCGNALSDLVATYRAEALGVRAGIGEIAGSAVASQLDAASDVLDAMRTRLVQEGEDELDLALAYLDAGRMLYRALVLDAWRIRNRLETT